MKRKILFNWSLAILWMIIIFWSSSISSYESVVTLDDQNYNVVAGVVHIILYFMLTFLLVKAFLVSGFSLKLSFLYGFLISVGFGAMDEWHQYYVPGREMHFSDWLLDVLGALIALLIIYNNANKYRRKT